MQAGYKTLIGIGLCSECNVIYKLRAGQEPEDGIHRCASCGGEIHELDALASK